jgi:hypothetical protein
MYCHSHAEAIELPDERLLNDWIRNKCCFVPSNKIKKRLLKIVAVNNFLSSGYFDDSTTVLCLLSLAGDGLSGKGSPPLHSSPSPL